MAFRTRGCFHWVELEHPFASKNGGDLVEWRTTLVLGSEEVGERTQRPRDIVSNHEKVGFECA